jgi:predicted esterase
LDKPRSNGEFIEIAPFGRDKYNAFGYQYSDIDIHEAIEDAIKHFAIDESRIVIAGFSMGGYGALATYYRNPSRFLGVAVFAGHPNLANEWLDSDAFPDFTHTDQIAVFSDTPVFIYHGTADPALGVSPMLTLASELEQNGAIVDAYFVKDRGHVYQDEATHQSYVNWLTQLISQ